MEKLRTTSAILKKQKMLPYWGQNSLKGCKTEKRAWDWIKSIFLEPIEMYLHAHQQ